MTREPADTPADYTPFAFEGVELPADDGRSGQELDVPECPYDPGMIRQIDETVIQGVHS